MNLRDFLDRREKELTEQLAERKRRTIPFEAELAEISRAKKALVTDSATAPTLLQMNELRRYLGSREHELMEAIIEIETGTEDIKKELSEVQKVKASIGLIPTKQLRAGDAFGQPFAQWEIVPGAVRIPYQSMTIKELVLKALKDHFPEGATIAQLIEFFREKWGRDIDRPSLSPQLSRLFAAAQITQFGNRREWHLMPEKPPDVGGRHPFLTREGIVWKFPSQAREGDDIPAKIRETSRPDFDEPEDRR